MQFIPQALAAMAAYRQFILYRLVPRNDGSGKTDKFPVNATRDRLDTNAKTGQLICVGDVVDAHEPNFWLSADEALYYLPLIPNTQGIGFVFTEQDPFYFIDIDACAMRAADGSFLGWSPIVAELSAQLPGAAIEISQSGNGLHIFGTGTAPSNRRIKDKTNKLFDLYTEKRFAALTGRGIIGDIRTEGTAALHEITEKHLKKDPHEGTIGGWTTEPVEAYRCYDNDGRLIERMRRSESQAYKMGQAFGTLRSRFEDLWTANADVLSQLYPADPNSHDAYNGSVVDAALFQHLAFWTGKNCERMREIAFQSALVRDKWHDRPDYIEDTILKQVARQKDVLIDPPAVEAPQPPAPVSVPSEPAKAKPRATAKFIQPDAALELFDGCIYIQDHNKAMLPNGDIVDQARFKAKFGGRIFVMDDTNDRTSRDAWECFTQHESIQFPYADGSVFRPDLEFQAVTHEGGRAWVNTYKTPLVARRPGDVSPFLDLLRKLLPNGDDALSLLCYMAAVVQYPGVKFKWAPFLQGTEGNGKSTLVRCLRHALGNRYVFSLKSKMIENNFNSWMEGSILYVADDIYKRQDRAELMDMLRTLITEEEQPIEYKGIDVIMKPVCGNFFFIDNHRDALITTASGRRIAPYYCAQQTKRQRDADGLTPEWFATSYLPWLKSGGFEYVAEYLHTMQIDPRYNPAGACAEAPRTTSTEEAIEDNRTGIEKDILEWIQIKEPGFGGDFISVTMLKTRLQRPMSDLKIKETLERLGYEIHPALPRGLTVASVMPDGRPAQLYVKCDSVSRMISDAYQVGQAYQLTQQTGFKS